MRYQSKTDVVSPGDAITRQAAEWLVRMSADDLTLDTKATTQAEFEKWQQADPRHAQAAKQMARIITQTQQVRDAAADPTPARAAIEAALKEKRKSSQRKNFAVTMALVFALVMPVGLVAHHYPLAYLLADMRTTTSEWKTHRLDDRSQMTLGSNSAINITFNGDKRELELVRGEILVDVAKDPTRSFVVKTQHGNIRALGTRFVVTLGKEATTLTMLESSALMQTAHQTRHHPDELMINAGQQAQLSTQGISAVVQIDNRAIADAWKFHQLVVENRPLRQVLDELARYHTGYIHYDHAALKNMHVSAVLPLDDTEKALQLLAQSFPLNIRTITPWLVIVEATDSAPVDNTFP